MGSKNSSEKQCDHVKINASVDDDDAGTSDAEAARRQLELEHLEGQITSIEESLREDTSMPNVIAQLANIIEMEGGTDKMACVKRIVDAMGSEWRGLMQQEGEITKAVGKEEMDKLKNIRLRYFLLLLETKNVIVGLLEESEIQKENVMDSLRVVKIAKEEGEAKLSESDRLVYDDSIRGLGQWIDQSELIGITKKWNGLCAELQKQKSKFERLFEKYRKRSKLKKIGIAFGTIIALAAIIGIIIATSGAGAAVAGAIVAEVGTTMTKGALIATVTCSIALGVSTLGVGGLLVYGYRVKPAEMAKRIEKITAMLNDYIQNGLKIQVAVNDSNGQMTLIKSRLKFNDDVCQKMEKSLMQIEKYLDEYIGKGNDAVALIEKSCGEFITK
eukprot:1140708_1